MLYRICLETGADGDDATGEIDSEILGHFYAAPYAILEPELCIVLTRRGAPCGYILGTADSQNFEARTRIEWWPTLREKYPKPDPGDPSRESSVIRSIHEGYRAPELSADYPAHLHIDILPKGQGSGRGGQLIDLFIEQLRRKGVEGLHLCVSRGNKRAMDYYPRFGFKIVDESAGEVTYGMKL